MVVDFIDGDKTGIGDRYMALAEGLEEIFRRPVDLVFPMNAKTATFALLGLAALLLGLLMLPASGPASRSSTPDAPKVPANDSRSASDAVVSDSPDTRGGEKES